ncbi:MAG: hypothetical protein AB7G13_34805 [Lautropia sp.]
MTRRSRGRWSRLAAAVAASVAAATLVACGGGDRARFGTEGAAGLWAGSTVESSGTLDGVVLETGEYWLVFGVGGVARSLVVGSGGVSGGTFQSNNGNDYFFGQAAPFASSVAADVSPENALRGSVYLANRLERFDMRYVPDYRFPANPNQIIGIWRGTATTLGTVGDIVFTVAPGGDFAATLSGCEYSGRITPNRNGRNVFDFTFANQPSCQFVFAASGVAVASSGRLVFTGTTPNRGDVFYAVTQASAQ